MKKRIISIVMLIALISSLVVFSGCEKKEENVIKIGAILPLTGNLAFLGIPEKNALELAEYDVNNSDGVNGKQIQIIFEDSKGEPKQGITSVNKLLYKDEIKIIFTSATTVCIPTQKLIQEANGIQMAISMYPKLADMSEATFRIFPTGWQESDQLVSLHNKLGTKNVAIFYAAVPEMESEVNDYLIPGLRENGMNITLVEQYQLGEKNFKPFIAKIDRAKTDAIILIGFGFNMPPILKEISQSKLKLNITGGIGLMEFSGDKYAELIEGVIFICPEIIIDIKNSETTFRSNYIKKYGSEPPYDAYFIYDQFQILLKGLKDIDPDNINKIKSNILELSNYKGLTGEIKILKNGDATVNLIIAKYKNGKIIKY